MFESYILVSKMQFYFSQVSIQMPSLPEDSEQLSRHHVWCQGYPHRPVALSYYAHDDQQPLSVPIHHAGFRNGHLWRLAY